VVHVQLAGDGARRPLLDVIVTQDLCFNISGYDHDYVPFAGVVTGLGDGSGGAKILAGRGPHTAGRTNDSAIPAGAVALAGVSSRSPPSASRTADNHLPPVRVNPDASLFLAGTGNGVPLPHASAVRGGWIGSGRRRLFGCLAAPVHRNRRRNRSGPGRSSGKSTPDPGNRRTETAALMSHRQERRG
jgi:hypothetical protein